jgi:DNA-binding transcriptional LysR family regulator
MPVSVSETAWPLKDRSEAAVLGQSQHPLNRAVHDGELAAALYRVCPEREDLGVERELPGRCLHPALIGIPDEPVKRFLRSRTKAPKTGRSRLSVRPISRLGLGSPAPERRNARPEPSLRLTVVVRGRHRAGQHLAAQATPAGQALLETGRTVIQQADAALELARAVGTGRSGTLRVGVTLAIGPQELATIVRTLRGDNERSGALRDLRPGELGQSMKDRSVDIAFASASGIDTPGLQYAELRVSKMQLFVVDGHPLAAAGTVKLEDLDGHRLLAASRAGTPYTDLLVGRFADAGATVTPVEARVTGGAQLLTELNDAETVAAMPAGTRPRG